MWTMMDTEIHENTPCESLQRSRLSNLPIFLLSQVPRRLPRPNTAHNETLWQNCWISGNKGHLGAPAFTSDYRFPLPGMTSSGTKYRAGYGPHASGNDNPWQVFHGFEIAIWIHLRLLQYCRLHCMHLYSIQGHVGHRAIGHFIQHGVSCAGIGPSYFVNRVIHGSLTIRKNATRSVFAWVSGRCRRVRSSASFFCIPFVSEAREVDGLPDGMTYLKQLSFTKS